MRNGYAHALDVDKDINLLLEEVPITKANAAEWLKFARTVETSVNIIQMECMAYLTGAR